MSVLTDYNTEDRLMPVLTDYNTEDRLMPVLTDYKHRRQVDVSLN